MSRDNGSTFVNITNDGNYIWSLDEIIYNITQDTILRFTVENVFASGGFVATVTIPGVNGELVQLYTDAEMTNFTSSDDIKWSKGFNDPSAIWYTQSGINSELEPGFNYDATWVWSNNFSPKTIIF